jgi:branched-chain amino acid transport system ATP-binding protein
VNRTWRRSSTTKRFTIFLVEQAPASSVAAYGYVLQKGEVVIEGTAEQLRQSEVIQSAYLKT